MAGEVLTRSFIAVDISSAVREELTHLVASLKKYGADVKWVEPENLHLTLRFLGSLNPMEIKRVADFLKTLSSTYAGFQISLMGVGAFPNIKRPKIIWVGVREGKEELLSLAEKMESGLQERGFGPPNKPFSAHLTLGRMRSAKNLGYFAQGLESVSYASAHAVPVEHLTFYRSILTAEGPRYEVIESFGLKGV